MENQQSTLPMYIGTLLSWMLLGMLIVQAFIYFTTFPKDSRWSKFGVTAVLALELLETCSNLRDMARVFGPGWGDRAGLDEVGWIWFSVVCLGPFIASIGQIFFAYRLYRIGGSVYVPMVVSGLSVFQLGAGLWTGVGIVNAGRFSLLQAHNVVPTSLWLASTSLCDLLIVFGMAYYLVRGRGDRAVLTRSSRITRVLYITVETGLLCAVFALVDLFLFASPSFRGQAYHLGVCIELSKVYSNSILLIFNSRATIAYPQNNSDIGAGPVDTKYLDSVVARCKLSDLEAAPPAIVMNIGLEGADRLSLSGKSFASESESVTSTRVGRALDEGPRRVNV
ncbi:hypothetical protein MKEN_00299500 [Mycena kentingensis (nom. inval.)]|nr:hypothetical protein MKEN_00299500 [Mycena kentingensis (nom. inval.)]